jgi:hypothetical protein
MQPEPCHHAQNPFAQELGPYTETPLTGSSCEEAAGVVVDNQRLMDEGDLDQAVGCVKKALGDSPLPNKVPNGGNPRMKLLKNVALAAAVAVSVGFVGACASAVPPTTTTTESSTTAPPVTTSHTYYTTAPPVTTNRTTATTTCPAGTQLQSDGMCR